MAALGKAEGSSEVTTSDVKPLHPPLAAVLQLLERFRKQGLIIGGVAASVLGTPRLTAIVDVVLLLSVSRLPELFDSVPELGLAPRRLRGAVCPQEPGGPAAA